ncbi:MAG: hypothetical protein NTY53_21840 [Kiritimatiellaeota bacterium]|nr:hypothetical protein [Kiritimatiellota bacterium]
MKTKWLLTVGGLLLGTLMVLGLPGCEGSGSPDTGGIDSYFADNPFVSDPRDPSSPHDVVVTPAVASASYIGQAMTFTVKGGRPAYNWVVVNGNGSIAGSPGDGGQAVYTVNAVAQNSVIVYDAQGHSAIASISASAISSAVAISPTSASLTNNNALVVFTANSGLPPYNWSVLNGNGNLNASSGTSVIYKRLSAGDNAVTVTDSAGGTASAVVQQP